MRVLLLVAALAVGLASALDLDAEWGTFKTTYNKLYKDAEEERYRCSSVAMVTECCHGYWVLLWLLGAAVVVNGCCHGY